MTAETLKVSDERLRELLKRYDFRDIADYTDAFIAVGELLSRRSAEGCAAIPDVCLDNDGDVSIEWYRDKDNTVALSTDGERWSAAWIVGGVSASTTWLVADATPDVVNAALAAVSRAEGCAGQNEPPAFAIPGIEESPAWLADALEWANKKLSSTIYWSNLGDVAKLMAIRQYAVKLRRDALPPPPKEA